MCEDVKFTLNMVPYVARRYLLPFLSSWESSVGGVIPPSPGNGGLIELSTSIWICSSTFSMTTFDMIVDLYFVQHLDIIVKRCHVEGPYLCQRLKNNEHSTSSICSSFSPPLPYFIEFRFKGYSVPESRFWNCQTREVNGSWDMASKIFYGTAAGLSFCISKSIQYNMAKAYTIVNAIDCKYFQQLAMTSKVLNKNLCYHLFY